MGEAGLSFAREIEQEIFYKHLAKPIGTRPQSVTEHAQRAANVRGAFRIDEPTAVAGRDILLVDDLVTTGATAGACASTLFAAGAASVTVISLGQA